MASGAQKSAFRSEDSMSITRCQGNMVTEQGGVLVLAERVVGFAPYSTQTNKSINSEGRSTAVLQMAAPTQGRVLAY
jgi:hypothetical protein